MKPLPRIIGLTGHMRAGKDTVADILVAEFGYTKRGFAQSLKDMAIDINPLIPLKEHLGTVQLSRVVLAYGWEGAKDYPEVRRFLQALGTEGARKHLGEDVWINAWARALNPLTPYVVPDVRFPNEAEAIRSMGGVVWRVVRPGFEGDGHASEAHVDSIPVELTIKNNGTRSELAFDVRFAAGVGGPAVGQPGPGGPLTDPWDLLPSKAPSTSPPA